MTYMSMSLTFWSAIHQLAEEQIEIGKRKYIKSEEEANPNLKFVENKRYYCKSSVTMKEESILQTTNN